jgi:hypothetical protein
LAGAPGAAGAALRPRHSAAISKEASAQQYLSIVSPLNAVADRFNNEANAWTSSTTNSQAENDAKPVMKAILKLNTELVDDHWPSSSKMDVKALITIDALLVGDFRSLSSANLADMSSVIANLQRDQSELGEAASRLRQNLGLPSVTS